MFLNKSFIQYTIHMKTQTLIILLLITNTISVLAQDISGKWTGIMYQDPDGLIEAYYYEFNLKQDGDKVKGTSYVTFKDDPLVNGLMQVEGTFDGTYFTYKETKILKEMGISDYGVWCVKTAQLKFKKVGSNYQLSGDWEGKTLKGDRCAPGNVTVTKAGPKVTSKRPIKQQVTPSETNIDVIIKTASQTGQVLATNLEISGKSHATNVKSKGEYKLQLKPSQYLIKAQAAGYYTEEASISLKSSDDKKEVKLTLRPIHKGDAFVIENLQFEQSKAIITTSSKNTLNKLVDFLKKNPQLSVQINGHTDNVGSQYLNRVLSFNRANAVLHYLVKKGIAKSRLVPKGFGSTKPIANNDTEEGKKKNRRVEVEVLGFK